MPSIGLYFLAAIIVLIIVMMSVPSDSRTLSDRPASGYVVPAFHAAN
ncbi:MAG: hypothetical protein JNM81_03440 [Rhodospirillaceae bacterium]|nr:hypothetical protein [Rhodospirillaceae bacterium]